MSRYSKEYEMVTKALDLQNNEPMSYQELRKVLFHVKENVFLNILSDMMLEERLISQNDMYLLPPVMYAQSVALAQQKRQAVIDANNRLAKIRNQFDKPYYALQEAQQHYRKLIGNDDVSHFHHDMSVLNYTVASDFVIFKFQSIGEFLTNELLQLEIVDLPLFCAQYAPLVQKVDMTYWLEKLCANYQLLEFEKDVYLNIAKLNKMGIYTSNIRSYCTAIYQIQESGDCFSIASLHAAGFTHPLEDLGMSDLFYESLLKYDPRFLSYKMTHCYVFSTHQKPSIAKIVFSVVKQHGSINIYQLQSILQKQYGVATTIVSDAGSLINQALLFDSNTPLFYSKEFEKIYFDKNDYYKEIAYDE